MNETKPNIGELYLTAKAALDDYFTAVAARIEQREKENLLLRAVVDDLRLEVEVMKGNR